MESGIWNPEYFYLALLWSLWGALHSLMISRGVVTRLERRFGDRYRYYRLFYNVTAVLTLVPVLLFSRSLSREPFFTWTGAWRPVQLLLAMGALALFYWGARHYDLQQFLGLRQIREHESGKGLTRAGGLDRSGVLGLIRHPWYAGGILLLWARPLDGAALVTSLVLSLYLVVGAFLEERKLVAEFGEEYRRYQQEVPMFFPGMGKK